MEKKTLEAYRIREKRIEKLRREIENLEARDITTLKGTVKMSESQFPYIQGRTSVLMDDPEEKEYCVKRIKKKENEIRQLRELNKEVDSYVDNIQDSLEKTIIEMYYIDEKRSYQKEIADLLDVSREEVSKAINKHRT